MKALEKDSSRWARDPETGEFVKVRGDMTYRERKARKTFAQPDDKSVKIVYNNDVDNARSGVVTRMMNTGQQIEIGIEIDELTPCLRKTSTGQIVSTSIEKASPAAKDTAQWEFDWTKPERDGYQVFALKAEGDARIQGLIVLKSEPNNRAVNVDIVEAAPQNNLHNPRNKSHSKAYTGVGGHLFAEAARQSTERGFGGYVYFKAKTNLIEYYEKELGAELINFRARTMAIDESAAQALIKKYFGGE
ncbi:MAG: hypothetical protein PHU22_01495 [Eubacteriales bacterium]|nr:hypothetical protein [Eubacteriales bacterium]